MTAPPTKTINLKLMQVLNWEVLPRCLHLLLLVQMWLTWAAVVGAPWLVVCIAGGATLWCCEGLCFFLFHIIWCCSRGGAPWWAPWQVLGVLGGTT